MDAVCMWMESMLLSMIRRGVCEAALDNRNILLMRTFQSGKCYLENLLSFGEGEGTRGVPYFPSRRTFACVRDSFLAYLARCMRRELMISVTPQGASTNVKLVAILRQIESPFGLAAIRIRQRHTPNAAFAQTDDRHGLHDVVVRLQTQQPFRVAEQFHQYSNQRELH